jgi:thiamine-triphosphatase
MDIVSLHSANTQLRRLEVERKFLATPAAISYLRSNGGGSAFKEFTPLGNTTIHDIYYDRNGCLFSKGVYVRLRNGQWEAKVRAGGDFINSAFTEIDGKHAVKEVVEQNLGSSADGRNIEEMLFCCAEFVTERESWVLEGRFNVDVDTTDFGHVVGEVELLRFLENLKGEDGEGEKERVKKLRAEMDREIEAFMISHPQAFPAKRPVGKMSAYFQQVRR